MEGWAGVREGVEPRGVVARAEALACRLYPHRAALVTVGLASFLAGVFPLVAVVHGHAALASWHVLAFGASIPLVLWALCLAMHATFFDPAHGVVETFCRRRASPRPWTRRLLRGYATLTVAAFAVAPLLVLLAVAS